MVKCIYLYCVTNNSHYFLADNYKKYIGWMLYDKVQHTYICTLYHCDFTISF